ncbi:MAG: hypothetical protein ACO3JL_06170 [Myxococcota bacterium]
MVFWHSGLSVFALDVLDGDLGALSWVAGVLGVGNLVLGARWLFLGQRKDAVTMVVADALCVGKRAASTDAATTEAGATGEELTPTTSME